MDIEKILSGAVTTGETKELKKLFTQNTSPDFLKLCEKYIFTALAYSKTEVVEVFLDAGVNPNSQNVDTGWTPLHNAAHGCQISIIKKLIKLGAVIDSKDKYGNTPLFRAMPKRKKCPEILKILLDNGADRTISNNYGVSPEDLAKRFKFDLDTLMPKED